MTTTNTNTNSSHPFERAGLGRAPFTFHGFVRKVGPIRYANADGTVTEIGGPGQPMGTCAYCGQGIANCAVIRSADGREFTVGDTCVEKTDDTCLHQAVRSEAKKMARETRKARESARIMAAAQAVGVDLPWVEDDGKPNDGTLAARLALEPHPNKWRREKGDTLLDWYLWMAENSGHTGRLKATRVVEGIQKRMREGALPEGPAVTVEADRDERPVLTDLDEAQAAGASETRTEDRENELRQALDLSWDDLQADAAAKSVVQEVASNWPGSLESAATIARKLLETVRAGQTAKADETKALAQEIDARLDASRDDYEAEALLERHPYARCTHLHWVVRREDADGMRRYLLVARLQGGGVNVDDETGPVWEAEYGENDTNDPELFECAALFGDHIDVY